MMGMSPYEFDKRLTELSAQNKRQARNAWMFAGSNKTRSITGMWSAVFSRTTDKGLERKARHVLEDLLKHEKPEIRLRAAEIIVGARRRNNAH